MKILLAISGLQYEFRVEFAITFGASLPQVWTAKAAAAAMAPTLEAANATPIKASPCDNNTNSARPQTVWGSGRIMYDNIGDDGGDDDEEDDNVADDDVEDG